MNESISLETTKKALPRGGCGKASVDAESSADRLRSISMEPFCVLSAALREENNNPLRQRRQPNFTDRPGITVKEAKCAPTSKQPAPVNRCLAEWQTSRVMTYIDAHIDSTIYTRELAALARLSSYHFCRVFRETHGAPPHRYVMQKRVALAQVLMLTTHRPLGQIAMDCGMSDQAHFNKIFRRFMGESPGSWRRARRS
jgi:AraC-like DNA-binding protein